LNYKISVIIPVYNVEEYIKDCLDSIINQTIGIENIEVIVVNDCTPDNSMEIVRKYAEEYPSIKIVEHEFNQGLGQSRNTGLKYVTTNYISFIDSDDFISENTYETCLEKFKRYNCDFVIYEYDYYSESGRKYNRNPSYILFNEDKVIDDIIKTPEIIFSTSMCNKVFPKKFKDILKFPSTIYEDMVPTIMAIFSSKRIYVTNQCKYYYRKRENENKSITDDFLEKTDSYRDRIFIHYELYTLLEEYPNYKPLIDWINARDTRHFLHNLVLKDNFSHKERKEIFNKAKEYMGDVSETTLNKFGPFWIEFLRDVQTKSYWMFFFKYRIYSPKIRTNLRKVMKNQRFNQKTLEIFEISLLIFISFFYMLNPKNRKIWLFCERPSEAKDNGYKFFKYMRENHPEVNSYYVIDKKYEVDYDRIKSVGNIIQYGSWKHKLYFILSKKLVFAHKGIIEPWNYKDFKKHFQKVTLEKKLIFLQHGVIKDDVSDILGKRNPNNQFDLFICGAKPEYDYIDANYGYLPGEVAYTGLARFDYLNNANTKNQILLMPTWRSGIVQPSWIENKVVDDNKFLNSRYYEVYQSFINNEKLIELLEKNNFNLVFYPHFEVQQYLKYFTSSSNRILIANKELYDVQTLLMESKLLITDFSSVYFDFAYMNKPLVYYQFDKDSFFANHYKKGYFSYEEHGFGPVLETEDEVVDLVENIFKKNFAVEDKYGRRTDEFFVLKDTKNCERIYNKIINLENRDIAIDNLIAEIFEKYTKKFTVEGLNVYRWGNFLMYIAGSKEKINKIWLHVFPEDPDELNNKNLRFNYLDFDFRDLSINKYEKSKYKNKNIAIVKLPNIKIKNVTTGKIRDKKNNRNMLFKLAIKKKINKSLFRLKSKIFYETSKSPNLYIILNINETGIRNALINIKGYRAIKKNNLFDMDFYLKNYSNVKSGMDPLLHYIYHGFKEGKEPSSTFKGKYYLKVYKDVKKSNLNPLVHYGLYGINEGRRTHRKLINDNVYMNRSK
jgi:Putative glycosyl/glycerophosphate transferases involved in teichoic acid biosynthesis TagF/TagB/EpsJ/RodC